MQNYWPGRSLSPSRGGKKTTDHPPIYPTGVASPGALDDRQWRIYELVVRRFFATLADDAVVESTRIDLDINREPFFLRGSRIVEPGWMAYYPYTRQKDAEVPALAPGDPAAWWTSTWTHVRRSLLRGTAKAPSLS